MKSKKNYKKSTNVRVAKKLSCYYCDNKKDPDYKDIDTISKFISDRARILSRGRSGVCNKHQRKIAEAVKLARFMAIMPYTRNQTVK